MAKIVKRLPKYHHSICVTETLSEAKKIARKIETQVKGSKLKIFDYGNKPLKATNGMIIKYALLVPAVSYKKVDSLNLW